MKHENMNPLRATIDSAITKTASSLKLRQVFRSTKWWKASVIEWPSVDVFLATSEINSGVHSVPIGEFGGKQVNYDFLLTARPGTVMLCHFHGNAPRDVMEPPIFAGRGVTRPIATSMFIPSDPILGLDEHLPLAWHFGCEGIRLQAITVCIVQKLQALLQAPRVVTWGGSGGGFAAIRIARDLPNAIAMVWNPQTNIAQYIPEAVSQYLRVAFPTAATDGPIPSDSEQFSSMCTEVFRAGYQGHIVYLQECTDWHVNAHLEPFLSSFCGKALPSTNETLLYSGLITEQLYLHLGHWGHGHVPPDKDILSKLLGLLSDSAITLERFQDLACFPDELPENTASNSSYHNIPAVRISGLLGVDDLRSSSSVVEALNLKEILAVRVDRIADDFQPFDATVNCSGDILNLPLFTGEMFEASRIHGIRWDQRFVRQAQSSVMWLFSLATIGRLLSTFQQRKDNDALQIAVAAINSFLDYSSVSDNQLRMGRIPSADHSAATRVKVLIKFIQVMRERQDIDYAFLQKVCDCLKYWSDWLAVSKHYKKNNHGLMGSIALLHSAIQFGSAPCARGYLDVASSRIIELVGSAFDRQGLCNENSIGYHTFNLQCYRRVQEFCKYYCLSETLVNFLDEFVARAKKALEFCIWQDGSIPPIGDSSVYKLRIKSRNESQCFSESGFAVVKNNDLYLSIICGARTEIHKQVDDTSITLRFKNRNILIDGGAYLYDQADPYRRCLESSLGHSGIFLKEFDGLLRREYLRKFGPVAGIIEHFEEGPDGVRIKCVYSVRNGRVVFVRNIFVCWPDEVAIVDSVDLNEKSGSPASVQRFLFGPTLNVRFDERNKLILSSDDFSCTLFQLLDCDGELYYGGDENLVRGWFSEKYKEKLVTFGVDFACYSHMSRFSTIIKLAKCVSLSECSTAVRSFAGGADPFVSTGMRHSAS